MLVDEPVYMQRNCSPMCEHEKECSRCHRPKCIKSMFHSRLHGYTCLCGSQEWKPVFDFDIMKGYKMAEEKTTLEITNDPTTARSIIQELIKELRGKDGKPANRETALAVTKLQEASYWLGEAMFGTSSN